MAGPQLENGFTQIANELLEAIMRTNFNATQLKIIFCVIRFTYGFQRKSHTLSISFISRHIGISKRNISDELSKLINSNVLIVPEDYTATTGRKLQLNKDYKEWVGCRSIVQQVKNSSTVESDFNRGRELYFNTGDEADFNRGRELYFNTGDEADFNRGHELYFNQEINNKIKYKENINKYIAHAHEQNISDEKASLNNDLEKYFDEIWKSYPLKKGKGRISTTKKKELYKLGDEIKRCVSRYIAHVENERNKGFKELRYQDGSTFFNRGYIDFLDENFQELEVMGEENNKTKKVVDFEC